MVPVPGVKILGFTQAAGRGSREACLGSEASSPSQACHTSPLNVLANELFQGRIELVVLRVDPLQWKRRQGHHPATTCQKAEIHPE